MVSGRQKQIEQVVLLPQWHSGAATGTVIGYVIGQKPSATQLARSITGFGQTSRLIPSRNAVNDANHNSKHLAHDPLNSETCRT